MKIVRKILIVIAAFLAVYLPSAPASAGPIYDTCYGAYEQVKYHWHSMPGFCTLLDPLE